MRKNPAAPFADLGEMRGQIERVQRALSEQGARLACAREEVARLKQP